MKLRYYKDKWDCIWAFSPHKHVHKNKPVGKDWSPLRSSSDLTFDDIVKSYDLIELTDEEYVLEMI